jgi:GT2 family glycosyltransferase
MGARALERAARGGRLILCMTPYAADMNLGRAYNEAMELLPDDAWAVFLDHDAWWTTKTWHRQWAEAIAFRPDAGVIVACTNRIAAPWQQVGDRDNHDVAHHRAFGAERAKTHRSLLDTTDTKGFGGVAFAISKRTWTLIGGARDGMFCVDHHLHFACRKAGLRVYLHEGLYVYHWRRAFGDNLPRDTPRAANCPCRGPEKEPKVRIQLP